MEVVIVCALILFLIFGLTAFIGAPYVPTRHTDIQKLLRDELRLTNDDVVLDVGSGDGAVLQEVARTGAQAIGYEINPFLVLASRWRLRKHAKNVRIKWTNAWTTQPAKTHHGDIRVWCRAAFEENLSIGSATGDPPGQTVTIGQLWLSARYHEERPTTERSWSVYSV